MTEVHNEVTNDDIREYYSQLHGAYQRRWVREGHTSIHAGYFDDEHTDHASAVENMKRTLADAVDVGPDDRVLDAGCGLGETTTWIASERGADVVGINISRMQLGRARTTAEELGVTERADFRYDDFTEMETVEDDSVDVVWGLESMCYAENKRDVLEQAARVLKPGGRIVVADGFMTERNLTDGERKVVRKWLEGWELPNLAHLEDFLADLEDLGFDDVEYEDAKGNVMPSSKSMYRFSLVGIPIGKLLTKLNVKTDRQFGNTVACYYQHKALKKGLCTYAIVSGEL